MRGGGILPTVMASVAFSGASRSAVPASSAGTAQSRLSPAQQRQVALLKARDAEVRAHEAAHRAAGGDLAGPARFSYQVGPDGRSYAVGGEVAISTGATADPVEAIAMLRRVRAAALAPAQPSGQDLAVAAQAMQGEAQARAELARTQTDRGGTTAERSTTEADPGARVEEGAGSPSSEGMRPAEQPATDGAGAFSSASASVDDAEPAADASKDQELPAAPHLPATAFAGLDPLRQRRQAEVAELYRRLRRDDGAGSVFDRRA